MKYEAITILFSDERGILVSTERSPQQPSSSYTALKGTDLAQFSPAELATRQSVVRAFVQRHTDWMACKLGCRMEETVLLELDFPIVQLASMQVLSEVPQLRFQTTVMQKLKKLTESVELPPNIFPAFRIHQAQSSDGLIKNRKSVLQAHWEDCPVLLRLRGLSQPVVLAGIPVAPVEDRGDVCDCVIVKREFAPEFLQFLQKIVARDRASRLCVYGDGARQVRTSGWDDVVLSESVVQLVRKDFESFLQREQWFRNNRLPFRRGYLLHGPPGNGKTSLIRAMLNTSGLTGHAIRLFQEQTDDVHLEKMFRCAANTAPSLVVIEDIDRAFPRTPAAGVRCNVSLQQLLNCLDGIDSQDGVVVVATANDPTVLDAAILRRPGRFDRVVALPAPDRELRLRYFRKFNPHLNDEALFRAAEESDGFSFAQLKEAYILAGQRAFERNSPVNENDILEGIDVLRGGLALVSDHKRRVGFVESSLERPQTELAAMERE
jgi:ATPase family associated with various cellular activities (AAA)